MNSRTGIEWTESTWNPTTGCDKVSPGCKFCYAEYLTVTRLVPAGNPRYKNGFKLTLHEDLLDVPMKRLNLNDIDWVVVGGESGPLHVEHKVFHMQIITPSTSPAFRSTHS